MYEKVLKNHGIAKGYQTRHLFNSWSFKLKKKETWIIQELKLKWNQELNTFLWINNKHSNTEKPTIKSTKNMNIEIVK